MVLIIRSNVRMTEDSLKKQVRTSWQAIADGMLLATVNIGGLEVAEFICKCIS